ncbi:hypothetical protein BGZ50_003745 [Haplosporangium sp. Z 11]|nr:hypothetical protein BGZ50_003745 [Haplosporangium sp. Z 11]
MGTHSACNAFRNRDQQRGIPHSKLYSKRTWYSKMTIQTGQSPLNLTRPFISKVQKVYDILAASISVSLSVVYENHAKVKLTLPYIAGYLAFREVEPLLALIETLRTDRPDLEPQVILVDGCGILHPRGFGLASHLGYLSNIPTIGCSKNFLVIHGDGPVLGASPTEIKVIFKEFVANNPDTQGLMLLKGDVTGKVYGAALSAATTKAVGGAQNPIFVSIGHKVSLETAVSLVRACSLYRVPEPIRQADLKSRTEIKKWCREQQKSLASSSSNSGSSSSSIHSENKP